MDETILDKAYVIEWTKVTIDENATWTRSIVEKVVLKKSRLRPTEDQSGFMNEVSYIFEQNIQMKKIHKPKSI
jgi:hypothetical protein